MLTIPDVTEGQLCTVLTAKEEIYREEEILIIASDSYIISDIGNHIKNNPANSQGLISVINLPGDRYSFARTDDNNNVIEVAEKTRISDHASTGIYYFSNGKNFVDIGESMISNKEKTKGEYYVIPVYQKMIDRGDIVRISRAKEMWDLGTPAAKKIFENKFNV